ARQADLLHGRDVVGDTGRQRKGHQRSPPGTGIGAHPPKGMGPRCSASGPRAATGRNSNAPMITVVPNTKKPKVAVAPRMVPRVNGLRFLRPRLAAIAIGATIGM